MKVIKHILITLVAFAITLMSIPVSSATTYIVGDVNMDGSITISDVTALQSFLAGTTSKQIQKSLSDFNNDGAVDINDTTLLQQYIAGLVGIYDGYIYTTDTNKNATIIGYNGSKTSLTLPYLIYGLNYKVVAIGNSAFERKSITSVTIPKSIISIGYYAFQDCNLLETVIIKNANCHIDSSSFNGCISLSTFQQG